MNKNKQLVEVIHKLVRNEVKKEMKTYRKQLVKEIGSMLQEQLDEILEQQSAYRTDDAVLNNVVNQRSAQDISRNAVEQGARNQMNPTQNNAGHQDIRSKFRQIQEGVGGGQGPNPNKQGNSSALTFDEAQGLDKQPVHGNGPVPSYLQNLRGRNYSDLVKRFGGNDQ